MYLLDTCTFLWLAADQEKLSTRSIEIISDNRYGLFVSSISAFEISIKKVKKKLELPFPAADWFRTVCIHHGIEEVPLDTAISVRSAELPRHHVDPCDRFIIASALENNLTILTPDHLFKKYSGLSIVW